MNYLFAVALAMSTLVFIACDDNEEVPIIDEPTIPYVYLVPPSQNSDAVVFGVLHTPDGIIEKTRTIAPVAIRLSKAMDVDVTVTLATKLNGFPAEAIGFKTSGTHVIPAGELEVRDTLMVKEWSFAVNTETAATYSATISISEVLPVSDSLQISSQQNSERLTVNKSKLSISNVRPDLKPTNTSLALRSEWIVTWSRNQDDIGWTETKTVTDGNNNTYIYNNSGYIGLTVDLGAEQVVTALYIHNSFGISYGASECVLLSSEDGESWKMESDEELRDFLTPGSNQYASFAKPVTARYFRWKLWGTRALCSELHVYAQD